MFEQMIQDLEMKLAERENQKQAMIRGQAEQPLTQSPQFIRNLTIENNQKERVIESYKMELGRDLHRERSYER